MKPSVAPFVGKIARIVSNSCSHEFSLNTKVLLKENEECEDEEDCELIATSIANEDEWWYIKIKDIQIIGESKMYTIEEVRDKAWEAYRDSNITHLPFSLVLKKEFNEWWKNNKP